MINKILFLIFFCFSVFSYLNAKSYSINILKQTQNELVVEATFDKPAIEIIKKAEDSKSTVLTIDGLMLSNIPGKPIVPFLSKKFSLAGNQLEFNIKTLELQTIRFEHDFVNSENIESSNLNGSNKYINIEYLGLFRDVPLYSLDIFPVQISLSSQSASCIKKIIIQISAINSGTVSEFVPDSKSKLEKHLLNEMLINGSSVRYQKLSNKESITTGERYKQGRFKILVEEDGLYQITYQDLVDAGMDLTTVNPRNIRLFNKGLEIACYFRGSGDLSFDPGDYFEFWGEKNKNTFLNEYPDLYQDPFTDVNVYWLENSSSNGLRMVEESGALVVSNPANYIVPIFFNEKIHFEEDTFFEHFGQPSANLDLPGYSLDLWYYGREITAQGSRNYTAYLPHPWETGSNSVFVKALMRGKSFYSRDNKLVDHKVDLWLNEKPAGISGDWKDQSMHVIENRGVYNIGQSDIEHGDNTLRVQMTQTGVLDATLMNWFEITYLRKYRADQNNIVFKKQEGIPSNYTFQFEVDGFTRPDIELYKKGISKIVNTRIDFHTNTNDNFSSYRVSFQDSIFYSGIEYIALSKDQKKKPVSIIEDKPWIPNAITEVSLFDASNKAEYLIITHESLYENVLQLKQYHEQKGILVEIVKVEDIYDEFNYGIKSPLAIKNFFDFVYNNWDQTSPLYYVNLVGASSENYRTVSTSKPDLVPTFLFQTKKYGASGSDFFYTLISGDNKDIIPDLVIGRIPAKNNTEFLNYFDKLQNYELPTNMGAWTNRTLMISGNDSTTYELKDSSGHAFRDQNQRIINYKIPDAFFSRKLNTIRDKSLQIDPNYGRPADLIDFWDDGLLYINFFGHGGGGTWADVDLFDLDHIDDLNNSYHLPFVSSMTCFTGAFESKSLSGIAEKLITVAEKGAIGVYASSGLGWLHNDFALGWSFTENLIEKKLTIGESILLSKVFYLGTSVYVHETGKKYTPDYSGLRKSMVNQYNLLGEPFVYLPLPENDIEVKVNNPLPEVGDTLLVNVQTPYSSGEFRIELTNEKSEPLIRPGDFQGL